jgi:hypothetical protein
VDWIGLIQDKGEVLDSCVHSHKPPGCVKYGEFLD